MRHNATDNKAYAEYYLKKHGALYRKLLPVDVPFHYIAKVLCKGRVLDLGCGPGRYLKFFKDAIGVDHNKYLVQYAQAQGLNALQTQDFLQLFPKGPAFDTMLCSHVLEHMPILDAIDLLKTYLPYLKKQGRLVVILPHGKSYKNDPTHVVDFKMSHMQMVAKELNMLLLRQIFYPFPKFFSKYLVNDVIYVLAFSQ